MEPFLLKILIAICGLLGTYAAFGGEALEKGDAPILRRIRRRGWVSLALTLFAFILGVLELISTKAKEVESERRIADQQDSISKLEKSRFETLESKTSALISRMSDLADSQNSTISKLENFADSARNSNQSLLSQSSTQIARLEGILVKTDTLLYEHKRTLKAASSSIFQIDRKNVRLKFSVTWVTGAAFYDDYFDFIKRISDSVSLHYDSLIMKGQHFESPFTHRLDENAYLVLSSFIDTLTGNYTRTSANSISFVGSSDYLPKLFRGHLSLDSHDRLKSSLSLVFTDTLTGYMASLNSSVGISLPQNCKEYNVIWICEDSTHSILTLDLLHPGVFVQKTVATAVPLHSDIGIFKSVTDLKGTILRVYYDEDRSVRKVFRNAQGLASTSMYFNYLYVFLDSDEAEDLKLWQLELKDGWLAFPLQNKDFGYQIGQFLESQ